MPRAAASACAVRIGSSSHLAGPGRDYRRPVHSFTVPYTDHQIEVDPVRGVVMFYRNAWNRESSGTPDETHTFAALRADRSLMTRLTAMLAGNDAAELERLVTSV